ncbi:transposable element Tcb2 transposase [Trichonephila clavipes]|uniref:Transposable element Tcb2 transposase n=1 Tax=Trichonephila clavipes TaxID=2585209 RepID=A0A8X6SQ12_TRICX|nr:transposable element Tcb2 transposase [Trichonephila clavipes]
MMLLRLNRKLDEALGSGPVGLCLKTSLSTQTLFVLLEQLDKDINARIASKSKLPDLHDFDRGQIVGGGTHGPFKFLNHWTTRIFKVDSVKSTWMVDKKLAIGLGSLVRVPTSLNAIRYVKLLRDHLHPFILFHYPHSNGVFQQDNCTSHKSRLATGWLDEHSSELPVINWPLRSPNLNPIENLWVVLEQEMKGRHIAPTNLTELWTDLANIWQVIPMERFHKLIEYKPGHAAAFIKASYGPTLY